MLEVRSKMGESVEVSSLSRRQWKSRVLRRTAPVLFGLPVVAIMLSSCLGSNYDYVSYTSAGGGDTYLKIPSAWRLYTQGQIYSSEKNPPSPTQLRQLESAAWINIFAATGGPKFNPKIGFSTSYPVGEVNAVELSGTIRDNFSIATLRTLVFPSDPLGGAASGYKYAVSAYNEFSRPGGFRGSSLTATMTTPGGTKSTITQDAVVDQGTNWVYYIAVGCSATCYKANQGSIAEIVNSWNVKAVK